MMPSVMISSLLLAGWSGLHLVADLWVNPARNLIKRLNDPSQSKNMKEIDPIWSDALSSLLSARLLVPGNAEYHMWNGWLHHRRAESLPYGSDATKGHLREAETAYSEALELRPSWGLLWVNRAQIRIRQGKKNEGAMADLQHAISFDPHNPHVLKQTLRLGFRLWPGMNAEDRRKFLLLVKENFHLMPHSTIDLAMRYGLLAQIRPFYAADPNFKALWDKKLGAGR
ncbi:MAG TPA: hypothetical protein HPQ00_14810 [Magnetococcales bacterium]|nr:hypothetical protein [Magnetococcales bacterium]